LQVAREIKLDNAAPSVQFHYGTFDPTTSDSAPVPRVGTLALVDAVHLSFSLCIGATGSYVPYHSLIRTHATFMPDADWAINRSLPSLIPVPRLLAPVLTPSHFLTTRHQWFTCVRLSESHLTDFSPPFSTTLTTGTLDPRRLWRFEACSCKPTSRDLPSSLVKHQSRTSCDDFVRNTRPVGKIRAKRFRRPISQLRDSRERLNSSVANRVPWWKIVCQRASRRTQSDERNDGGFHPGPAILRAT